MRWLSLIIGRWRRSSVAGIIERGGGVRVVITQKWRFRFHVGPGERLVIVPGLKVHEPVPWEEIPGLIEYVTAYVKSHDTSLSH